MTVEKALNATAQGKKIGTLKIDPASLTVRAPGNTRSIVYKKQKFD